MAKRYICNGCGTLYDRMHKSDNVCTLSIATSPYTKDQTKYSSTSNRRLLNGKCFENHLTLNVKGKLVCQWRQVCRNCRYSVRPDSKHQLFKKFRNFCNKKEPSGHYCYLPPLKTTSCRSRFCRFSSIRIAHKTLRSAKCLSIVYRSGNW